MDSRAAWLSLHGFTDDEIANTDLDSPTRKAWNQYLDRMEKG